MFPKWVIYSEIGFISEFDIYSEFIQAWNTLSNNKPGFYHFRKLNNWTEFDNFYNYIDPT